MMKIREMSVNDVKEYANNARKNDKAVDLVAQSIQKYGFKNPVIVDKNNVIVAGHTRLKAALKLGMETIPVIMADDLTEEQVKAFRLADNKTAELATWDFDRLEQELDAIDDESILAIFHQNRYEDGQQYDGEISLEDFDDGEFKYKCPECGFRFNA